MAKLNTKEIRDLALRLISESQGGIRYAELQRKIHEPNPETPKNTINGSIWDIDVRCPDKVIKPSRGLFMPANGAATKTAAPIPASKLLEKDFYEPFAEYLKTFLDEAGSAEALGGAGLRTKWGTPDVVGVYKPSKRDRIPFPPEIISAEIKIAPDESITAFGQAIAYRLFSSKVYVVMPKQIPADDYSRLESLCLLFGVGLVLFDLNKDDPDFEIRVRAQRFSPDMFYVNKFEDDIFKHNSEIHDRLF